MIILWHRRQARSYIIPFAPSPLYARAGGRRVLLPVISAPTIIIGPTKVNVLSYVRGQGVTQVGGAADFAIKQGDTLPSLYVQLTDALGAPVNLSGASVIFSMRPQNGGALVVNARACQSVDLINGKVVVPFISADTLLTGTYTGEFRVLFSSGATLRFPDDRALVVLIAPQVNA